MASNMLGKTGFIGRHKARLIRGEDMERKAPLSWKIRNNMRWSFIKGWIVWHVGYLFSYLTGTPVLLGSLRVRHFKTTGEIIDYGVVGWRSVTTAFAEFMVDQLQTETSVWGDFKFHDSGVGVTAENITDTDMETTDGESRVAGTQTESTAVIYETVGTIAYTSTKAITEHGVFSIITSGTLMDRTKFAAINVINGDSIEHTYDLTVTAGG